VARGYNLNITNPNVVDDGHEDPDVLLARYADATAQVQAARETLRASFAEALLRD
jgi:type I restriction enzyme M protein